MRLKQVSFIAAEKLAASLVFGSDFRDVHVEDICQQKRLANRPRDDGTDFSQAGVIVQTHCSTTTRAEVHSCERP